jgi:regulatory protein
MELELEALEPLGGERFMVRLSDGREFKVSSAMVADFSLHAARRFSDEEIWELEAASAALGCRERALRLLGARAYSCNELYRKLTDKGETQESAAAAIAWLLERRFLDDEQYAQAIVRRCAAKGYGAARAKNELYRKGIDRELLDAALEELPDSEDTVYRLLCSKLKSDEPDRAEIKRATDALFRRGYSWDEIRTALERRATDNRY